MLFVTLCALGYLFTPAAVQMDTCTKVCGGGTRCAASAMQHVHVHGVPAIAKDLHPQSARSSSIGTERPNRRVGSALFTRRRRGFNKGSSSANDDDDEYDDEYIDNLINEKFDDVDFDDDLDDEGFIIDGRFLHHFFSRF